MQLTTYCFEEPGSRNTDQTLAIACERAKSLGIKQVVVASSHGSTARKAQVLFGSVGVKVIAVTIGHSYEADGWCMDAVTKAELVALGVTVVTGIHALGDGVGGVFNACGGRAPEEIVRDTLYRFSQGMKVAVECLLMAADAGVLDMTQEIISIGGTSGGADTAIVCKPAYPRTFNDLQIREVLAKPRVI